MRASMMFSLLHIPISQRFFNVFVFVWLWLVDDDGYEICIFDCFNGLYAEYQVKP